MGRDSETNLPIYNKCCVWLLENSKYTVDRWMYKQSLLGHILVLLFPVILCVMSFVTLKNVGLYVFAYHFLSLIFKLIVAYFDDKSFNKKCFQNDYRVKHNKSTPLYRKFFGLAIVVLLIALMGIFVFLPVLDFSSSNLYSLVVGISIIVNTLDSVYNGIISLYGATVEVK